MGPDLIRRSTEAESAHLTTRVLSALQHAILAVLLVVGALGALSDGAPTALTLLAVALFTAWYGAARSVVTWLSARAGDRTRAGIVWLVGLAVLWLGLVLISPRFLWVAFSLWLLTGHFLRALGAAALAAGVLAVVLLVSWRDGGLTTAGVVGPAVGALIAVAVSLTQDRLVREDALRRRLVADLLAAQRETEALQGELAEAHRASGAALERERLSRDIHDTLAQGFSSILLLAQAARSNGEVERLHALMAQVESSASEGLEESRRLVAALAPQSLESGGLGDALGRLLDQLREQTGTGTRLIDDGVPALPTVAEVALLRTAQGALANVRQHARASSVQVELEQDDDVVRLTVVDDGVGFRADGPTHPSDYRRGGYGLPSNRARLRALGGDLEVVSAAGQGTRVSAWLPFSTEGRA